LLGAAVSAAQDDGGEWYYVDARGVQRDPLGCNRCSSGTRQGI
jgi:hypothetical protein